MTALLVALVLSQSQVRVTNSTPVTAIPTRCVNAAGTAYVDCAWVPDGGNIGAVSGTVTAIVAFDGGRVTAAQGSSPWLVAGSDGGVLAVATPLDLPGTFDSFGALRVGFQLNQIDIPFFRGTVASLTTVTNTGTGGTSTVSGAGVISTGAGVTSSSKAVSPTSIAYRGGSEVFAYFTAAFTAPTSASSFQRIGLYDTNNGLFIGWEGTTFKATVRDAAVDTGVAKANWNVDTLTGAVGSKFTRNGVPEAINLALLNVYRVRLGWLGAAPIEFEVLAPDGHWVIFHRILYPNTLAIPSLDSADLPMTMHVSKTASDATDVRLSSGCWAAGTTTGLMKLTDTIVDGTLAQLSRAVLTGVTTGGGGGYVNVKVTPSGSLVADVTGTVAVSGAVAVNIADGGITVNNFPATQAVTLASTTVTGQVAVNIADGGITVTNFPATQAVTGPLTDVQLRATPVPVSGTVTVGTFPDNEPINVAQMNGVAVLMGTGATGTGSQRVTLATNSPGFSTSGGTIAADSVLTAGRAVAYAASPTAIAATTQAPAISDLEGRPYVNIGHPRAVFCQLAAASTTTLAELTGCAAVASNSYYVTSVVMTGGIATGATIPALIRSGTGTNCGTATATWLTCWHGTAGSCIYDFVPPIKITQGHAICGIDATVGTKSFMLTGYIAP